MKIFTIIIFSLIIFYNPNAIADSKLDCSQYTSKTLKGIFDKRRCEKGLPPKEKLSSKIGKKLKKLNPLK